ncbi:hypothetical protein GGX14DRAFT_403748 [Mycena pura]|uniref:Uncharacterized protein n=1 Tax=Mycena pura TaxID=153505 RepID=A0AAD6Y0U7_9AGAR|nr:hypothetical protein GGX14DRAFT_403748 [Mycena pura]
MLFAPLTLVLAAFAFVLTPAAGIPAPTSTPDPCNQCHTESSPGHPGIERYLIGLRYRNMATASVHDRDWWLMAATILFVAVPGHKGYAAVLLIYLGLERRDKKEVKQAGKHITILKGICGDMMRRVCSGVVEEREYYRKTKEGNILAWYLCPVASKFRYESEAEPVRLVCSTRLHIVLFWEPNVALSQASQLCFEYRHIKVRIGGRNKINKHTRARSKRIPQGGRLVMVWATGFENRRRKRRMRDARDGRLVTVPDVRCVDGVLEAAVVTATLTVRHLEGTVRLTSREQHPEHTNQEALRCDADHGRQPNSGDLRSSLGTGGR